MKPTDKKLVITALAIKYLKYIGETLSLRCRFTTYCQLFPKFIPLAGNICHFNVLHALIFELILIRAFKGQLLNTLCETEKTDTILREIYNTNPEIYNILQNKNENLTAYLIVKIV